MKILLAKDAGYCFGVRDAVNLAYSSAKENKNVYMLGTIVHNENVVDDLKTNVVGTHGSESGMCAIDCGYSTFSKNDVATN